MENQTMASDVKKWVPADISMMQKGILNYLADSQKKYGNFVHQESPVPAAEMYIIFDHVGIKHILQDNNKNYIKGDVLKMLSPLLGNGLLSSEGETWWKQRKLIQPNFHKERLMSITQQMIQCVDDLINEWQVKYPDGSEVDLTREMGRLALHVVAKALFKTDIEDHIPLISQNLSYVLQRMMLRFNDPVTYDYSLPTPENVKEKESLDSMDQIVYDIIEGKKKGIIPKNGDIIDMLMEVEDEETGEKMSDKQIRDEAITILITGHETTANALSFMFYALSAHPKIEKKVLDEMDAIDGEITPESLKGLTYIRQVVQETLRLYPPAFIVQRQAVSDDNVCGYHLPKGKNVLLPNYVVHRMSDYWENPEQFDPERFSPENSKKIAKFTYFPFGGGPRLCIGDQFAMYEMYIALTMIYRTFTFKNKSNYTIELEPAMLMKPKENVKLAIYKRK